MKRAETVFNGLVNVPNISIEYRGFKIVPKLDFGNYPYSNVNTYRKGYVVVEIDRYVNVMAGATWASSVLEAKVMIDCHIEADGDADLFWKILRAKQGYDEYKEV